MSASPCYSDDAVVSLCSLVPIICRLTSYLLVHTGARTSYPDDVVVLHYADELVASLCPLAS